MAGSPAALMGQPDPAGLRAAHAALVAGCGFLIARGAAPAGPAMSGSSARPLVRLRMAGNGLKELDRFLAIMIDECLAADGRARVAAAPHSPVDTAARLHRLGPGWSAAIPRLRAIARVRSAACGDPVLASWHRLGRDLAVASAGVAGQRQPAGAKPPPGSAISNAAMAEIAACYLALGDALWCHYGAAPAQP